MSKEEIYNEIDICVNLHENWDGYGAIPLIKEIGDITKKLLLYLTYYQTYKIYDAYPNPHGTIDIHWKNNIDDEKLILEIGLNGYTYIIFYKDNTNEGLNVKNNLSDDLNNFNVILNNFLNRIND